MTEIYQVKEIELAYIALSAVFAMRDEIVKTDVETLAASIKDVGLLSPIIVRETKPESPLRVKGFNYELISGHRRFAALKLNKAKTAPARIIDVDDATAFILALTENIERKDPEPLEEARAFRRAVDELHMQVKDIAAKIRRSPSYVSNRMRLLELPQQVQDALEKKEITPGHCEHGFLQLKHQQDQLELLKDAREKDGTASISGVKRETHRLAECRKDIEALANKLRELGDQVKFPKCPKCGGSPEPGYSMDLKKNRVQCGKCYHGWSLVKGDAREKETTLDGNVSEREKVSGGESVVKAESNDHLSHITIQQFFDYLAGIITKKKLATMMQIGAEYDEERNPELEITIKVNRKEIGKLPNVLLTPPDKKAKHKTDATLQMTGWGSNNKEILDHRGRLWDLEKAIDAKTQPAGIVRHELERLVVDHVALSKGKVLVTENGTRTIKAVHRDYTAIVLGPLGESMLCVESELRNIVKSAKKAGEGAAKKQAKMEKKGEPQLTQNTNGHRFLCVKRGPKIGDPLDWQCTRCGIQTADPNTIKDKCDPIKARKG